MTIYQVPRLFLLTPDLGDLVFPMGSSFSSYLSRVLAGRCHGLKGDYWALLVVLGTIAGTDGTLARRQKLLTPRVQYTEAAMRR